MTQEEDKKNYFIKHNAEEGTKAIQKLKEILQTVERYENYGIGKLQNKWGANLCFIIRNIIKK